MSYSAKHPQCLSAGPRWKRKDVPGREHAAQTGVIDRMGKVSDGNTVCDFDPRRSSASFPSPPPWCLWSIRAARSMCWIRRAISTSPARSWRPCGWPTPP